MSEIESKVKMIKDVLINRTKENTEIGLTAKENRLDSKLFGLYGELLAEIKTGGKKSDQVNQSVWDLIDNNGKTYQVKSRAIYSSNNDGIHIDFKNLEFDFLFLLVVDEDMNHLAEMLLTRDTLDSLCRFEKSKKFRLRDIRTKYKVYLKYSLLD